MEGVAHRYAADTVRVVWSFREEESVSTIAKEACQRAMRRRRENNGLNNGERAEFAYSPSTGAVGMRWTREDGTAEPNDPFRVFNYNDPMWGRSEFVTDWKSVGVCTEKWRERA